MLHDKSQILYHLEDSRAIKTKLHTLEDIANQTGNHF